MGAGCVGIIELAFLERIEKILRSKSDRGDTIRLCEYFDLVGGTSTGSIIAACLALGMSVAEILKMYRSLGSVVFKARRWKIPGLAPRFDASGLTGLLAEIFGDRGPLESDDLRTGFAAMARRFATGSSWLISNPKAPYWQDPPDRSFVGNRHYRLTE